MEDFTHNAMHFKHRTEDILKNIGHIFRNTIDFINITEDFTHNTMHFMH